MSQSAVMDGSRLNMPAEAGTPKVLRAESPDYLAGALLHSLMRPLADPYAISIFRLIVLGVITLGIVPLILLLRRWGQFIARERDQFWHLAQWMQSPGENVNVRLPRTPGWNAAIFLLRSLALLCALFAVGVIAEFLSAGHRLHDLFPATVTFFRGRFHSNPDATLQMFLAWSIALSIGYTAHWLSVLAHQLRVRRFVSWFNTEAKSRGVHQVLPRPLVFGLRPLSILAGILMASVGMLWALPMMLAGAAQRRYIRHGGRLLRAEFAQRVRDVLGIARPTMRVGTPVALRRKCPATQCQAPLPQVAAFCPRCGSRVAA